MKLLSVLVLMAVAIACAQATSTESAPYDQYPVSTALNVAIDRSEYGYGDTAMVFATGLIDSVVLLAMMCDVSFEGRLDGEWRPVFVQDCSRVRVRPTRINNGESAGHEYVLTLWPVEETARYSAFRVRARFQLEGSSAGYRQAYSPQFRITPR